MPNQVDSSLVQASKYLAVFALGAVVMYSSQFAKKLLDGRDTRVSIHPNIFDFETCAQHPGSKLLETYPAQCVTDDGVRWIQEIMVEEPPTLMPTGDDPRPLIDDQELSVGWYWGDSTQKKTGTPEDWVYEEAGRSSCWHQPNTKCIAVIPGDAGHTCPQNNWVNCMPGPDQGIKFECTSEYLDWATANCPGFEGAAL